MKKNNGDRKSQMEKLCQNTRRQDIDVDRTCAVFECDPPQCSCPQCGRPYMLYKDWNNWGLLLVCSGLLDPVNPCQTFENYNRTLHVACTRCGRLMIPVVEEDESRIKYFLCSGYHDDIRPCDETLDYYRIDWREERYCPECGRKLVQYRDFLRDRYMWRCSGFGMAWNPCSYSREVDPRLVVDPLDLFPEPGENIYVSQFSDILFVPRCQ